MRWAILGAFGVSAISWYRHGDLRIAAGAWGVWVMTYLVALAFQYYRPRIWKALQAANQRRRNVKDLNEAAELLMDVVYYSAHGAREDPERLEHSLRLASEFIKAPQSERPDIMKKRKQSW